MVTAVIVILAVILVVALDRRWPARSGCCASTSAGSCSGSGG